MAKATKKGADTPQELPASLKPGTKAYPHQLDAINRLIDNKGRLILAHGTGTGKTATAIMGSEALVERGHAKSIVVVVPSGLRENFATSGLAKFLKEPSYQIVASSSEREGNGYARIGNLSSSKRYTIVGYEMFVRNADKIMDATSADTLILDEFHKVRNESTGTFKSIRYARSRVKNFMGLTASPINNDPAELASLVSIAEGQRILSPGQFRSKFSKKVTGKDGGKPRRTIKNRSAFAEFSDRRIDYAATDTLRKGEMPQKDIKYVDVPMSDEQYQYHQMALKKLGPVQDYIARRNPDVTVKQIDPALIFAQLAHARQISNSIGMGKSISLSQAAMDTPKVKQLVDDTLKHLDETPDGQVVLYSNLIRGGVDVLTQALKDRGISHATFIGKGTEVGGGVVTNESRETGVKDFNAGKKRVIILSGAGAEGLSLNNATAFYALDGHFNPEKIMQAEARAVRLGGQSHRPQEKRVVDIRRYESTVPLSKRPSAFGRFVGNTPPPTVDQWVYDTAKRKGEQNEDFRNVMKEPTKYISKTRGYNGEWVYKYPPKKSTSFFSKATLPWNRNSE